MVKNLFIDHGMGVVIGETAQIGDNVTLFSWSNLRRRSLAIKSSEQVGIKRHPTLENDVIVGSRKYWDLCYCKRLCSHWI
ncbi:MAG: hypothetical protein CM15mP70_11070 [Pelagibacteraceae bacterium]|nr:MAG: hypothetical protein CM15mP70_11070 [Pelagibacteraceae bacterium]